MKKNLFVYILVILLLSLSAIIIFRPKNNDNLKKIKVAEVAHSVFYTPQYVAHALGYFKDEGYVDVYRYEITQITTKGRRYFKKFICEYEWK